ncbi:MAG: cytochrome b/b6 domain-containing protein [Coriobacteriales bacterium]|jgi:Ni/Fe-hydrogenase 1 B-type cytochrome subunit|nr:cytochrome b/b6 domain-containing protein [Coriobacteriales bacterium]
MAHLAHYRQAHPLVYVLTHWINLVSMLVLIFTGFYIHFPFFAGFMGIARGAHLFFAFILVANMLFRVVSAFFVKSAPTGGTRKTDYDWKGFLPQKDNRHQLGAWIKYYLFFKKEHPLGAKYGVPQKIVYVLVPVLILLIAFTGLCLWAPTSVVGPFAAVNALVGGVVVMRIVHFFFMFVFIIFMLLHAYLANVEGIAPTKMMFGWKEHGGLVYDPDLHNIVGEDDLGEEHAKDTAAS